MNEPLADARKHRHNAIDFGRPPKAPYLVVYSDHGNTEAIRDAVFAALSAAPLDGLREAAEDGYRVMDAATQWAAGTMVGIKTSEGATAHMRGYDALLDGTVRLGVALGHLAALREGETT